MQVKQEIFIIRSKASKASSIYCMYKELKDYDNVTEKPMIRPDIHKVRLLRDLTREILW